MKVRIDKSFAKDLSKIKDKRLEKKVAGVIEAVMKADGTGQIQNLKKLQGLDKYFRIRLGD